MACVIALLSAAACLFFLRFEHIRRRYRQRMRERLAERERIARDLHDTLLQGIQALLFRLQNWETDPALPKGYRDEVAAVVRQAREIVIEGRDRIVMLRRSDAPHADLSEALAAIGTRESAAHGPEFRIGVIGEVRVLRADTLEQLVDIGREAIRNCYQHARASRVDVCIQYRKRSLVLKILDDGSGILPFARQGPRHFGLIGMRERAEQLCGRLAIHRIEPHGTQVEVIIPARVAFENRRRKSGNSAGDVSTARP